MVCLYNITDASGEKIFFYGLTAKAVSRSIGIKAEYVYTYADKNWVYKTQYRIVNVGSTTSFENTFAAEWSAITEKLRRYPDVIRRIKIGCQ